MEEKINILLVEDNPGDARLIDIYLKESYGNGFALETVEYLSHGLDLIREKTFDVIIADLTLPDSDGLDTFRALHEHAPDIPIIVLTGMEDESVGINAVKYGAQDFLLKGKVKSKTLKRSINYSIERYKLLKELSENSKHLKEKTEALEKEQLKLAEAQKLAHIGSWEIDFSDFSIKWSDELYRIYGVDPSDFTPTIERFIEFIHPDDKEYVITVAKEHYQSEKSLNYYYRIVRPDGEIRSINGRGEPIMENGKMIRAIGTAQDVTERLHEEELEKLALAATKSYNSVIISDKQGKIEWVNEGFTKLTGYSLNDVVGTFGEILKQDDQDALAQQKHYYETILKEKKPTTYESKNFTKEGTEYWVISTLTPVLDKNGEVEKLIAIDSDISIRKQMEEELVLANKIAEHMLIKGNKALNELMAAQTQLQELMKVKEQFLANMSHEIRTPMNAIIGFTDLILKTGLTQEQRQYIDAIKTSGRNLLIIINDILDFSKIQSGKFVFEKIPLQLSQVISSLTEMMLPKSVDKNIRLSNKIDKAIPDNLIGDPTRLNQILLNLVSNAIKFTEKGEVKICVDLVNEDATTVELKFHVSDTGIGIPSNKLTSVFEGFTQATNDTTRKYGGTGLGLTIVKQLVELQGGKIEVKSKVGEGSTFSFNLIFEKDLLIDTQMEKKNEEQQPAETIEGLNVLLVEDNYLNQVLATKVLSDWNFKVTVADNGAIAVDKIQENNFDLVLMDIQLPEMDGYEATRHIRQKMSPPKSEVPIIAMTAHAIAGETEKCIAAGMDDYISKPFDEKVLYAKIGSVLKRKKGPETENGNTKCTDLSYLKQLAKGSTEFIKQMLTIFIDQTPPAIESLEANYNKKDWKALRAAAHKMKPSFSFVGIRELEKVIKEIEEIADKETDLDALPEKISKIRNVSTKAIKELEVEKELL